MAALLDEEILEYELITKKLNVTRTVIRALEEQNVARIESEQVWRNPIKNRKKSGKKWFILRNSSMRLTHFGKTI